MNRNSALARLTAALMLLLEPGDYASAQVAPTVSRANESVVTLNPFEVRSDSDVGYQATDTLAGSRMNTALKDTAASISVFTAEFIKDIGAFDLSEVLQYANNLQQEFSDSGDFGDTPGGNFDLEFNTRYRVRDIPAQIARNYFKWWSPTDTYNIGRVEDSRGPNSVLFGIGSAGGIINVATKQAELKRRIRTVSFAVGSNGTWRTALDVNQPLGNKAALRFNGLLNDTRSPQHYKRSESQRAHLALKYQINRRVQLRAEFEAGEIEINSGRTFGTFDSLTPWLDTGRPVFQPSSPNAAFAGLGARVATSATANALRFVSNSNQLINMAGQIDTLPPSGVALGVATLAPILDQKLASFLINHGGPGQVRNNPYHAASAFVIAELPWQVFAEIGFNQQDFDYKSYDAASNGVAHRLYGDPNAALPGTLGSNPYARRLYLETPWWNFRFRNETSKAGRASLSKNLDIGKWGKYRVAAFAEREELDSVRGTKNEVFDGAPFNASPENSANGVQRRSYVTEGDWGTYYVNSPLQTGLLRSATDPITGRSFSSSFQPANLIAAPTVQSSYMFGLQTSWFDGKLVAGGGYREDHVKSDDVATKRSPATRLLEFDYGNVRKSAATGRTNTMGLVWHATKRISLLYNQSNNIDAGGGNARLVPDFRVAPPAQGRGRDFGLSLGLLDGRLYARAVRYLTNSKGETINNGAGPHLDSHNVILNGLLAARLITGAEFDARLARGTGRTRGKESEGYEFSLIANPTSNWRLSVNYSITDGVEKYLMPEIVSWWAEAKVFFAKFPQNTLTGIGTDTIASEIKEEDDLLANLRSVEGIGIIGNRKHKANFFTRYTFRQGFAKGVFVGGGYRYLGKMLTGRTLDGTNRLQYAPPYGEASFLAGYERRLKSGRTVGLQLNIMNLFDETDPIVTRYSSTGNTYQIRRISIREPRTWRLSTNLSF